MEPAAYVFQFGTASARLLKPSCALPCGTVRPAVLSSRAVLNGFKRRATAVLKSK